jgi:hypothetical protein
MDKEEVLDKTCMIIPDSCICTRRMTKPNRNDLRLNTIGDENINIDKSHPSIIKIEDNKTDDTELSFRPVTEEYVNKQSALSEH